MSEASAALSKPRWYPWFTLGNSGNSEEMPKEEESNQLNDEDKELISDKKSSSDSDVQGMLNNNDLDPDHDDAKLTDENDNPESRELNVSLDSISSSEDCLSDDLEYKDTNETEVDSCDNKDDKDKEDKRMNSGHCETDDNVTNNNNSRTLRILSLNIRGLHSKVETLTKILEDQDIHIVNLSETLCSGSDYVEINGFRTFFRNRKDNRKGGGVAIMLREDIARSAVRVACGERSEFISVKINCYSPPLVITQCYGATPRQGYGFSEISEEIY